MYYYYYYYYYYLVFGIWPKVSRTKGPNQRLIWWLEVLCFVWIIITQ